MAIIVENNNIQGEFYTNNRFYVKKMREKLCPNDNYQKKLECDPVASLLYTKMHWQQYDALSIFTGKRGKGKSRSAISFGSLIDINKIGQPRFFLYCDNKGKSHPLSRVVYHISDLVRLTTQLNPPLPKGSAVVFDEVGVESSQYDYREKKNLIIRHVLNTYRYRCLNCIMTFPDLNSISIGARKLIDYVFDVRMRKSNHTEIKPYAIYYD